MRGSLPCASGWHRPLTSRKRVAGRIAWRTEPNDWTQSAVNTLTAEVCGNRWIRCFEVAMTLRSHATYLGGTYHLVPIDKEDRTGLSYPSRGDRNLKSHKAGKRERRGRHA